MSLLHLYAPANAPDRNRSPSIRRAVLLAACLLLTAGLLAGCADGDTKDTMDPTNHTEKTWDLREPVTREQVGMEDDEDDVLALYDTDEPHRVRLKLPENTTLTLPLTLLAFNSPGLAPSDPQPPTSLDGKTDHMPLDETIELYRSTLTQLNMDTPTPSPTSKNKPQTPTAPNTPQNGFLRI